jgi:DNA-binding CsgD family transcriptional regulator
VTTAGGRGWIAAARGELARADGAGGGPEWLAAIDAFDAVPDPLAAAYARFRAAEAGLRAEGVRADVGRHIREAAAIADATGALPLGAAVATLASRARIPVRLGGPTGADGVTPGAVAGAAPVAPDPRAAATALGLSAREIEVLELVTAGLSNGEIAERLFITRKTAAAHVTHILDKLGVANRVGAAMVAARVGLGAPSSASAPDLDTTRSS